MNPRLPLFVFCAIVVQGWVCRLQGDQTGSAFVAQNKKPIVLPPMIVMDTRMDRHPWLFGWLFAPRPWLYARVPGLVVLSKMSPSESKSYADGFLTAERMLDAVVPEEIWGCQGRPKILVICDGGATTANADYTRRLDLDLLNKTTDSNGPPLDAFSAAQQYLQHINNPNLQQQLAAYYDQEETIFFNRWTDPVQSTVDFAAGNDGADILVGRSLFRYLIQHRAPPLPPWLAEGLPTVMAQSHFYTGRMGLRMDKFSVWPNGDGSFDVPDFPHRLLPLDRLFAARPPPRDSPDFSLWSYQSALFLRWGINQPQFWKFASVAMHEGASEKAFYDCFGMSYGEGEAMLRQEFSRCVGEVYFHVQKIPPSEELKFGLATDVEIRQIVADLERLESDYLRSRYPDMAKAYLDDALAILAKGYKKGDKDPEFFAVWGLCAVAAGDSTKARELLETMAAGNGAIRPDAYIALAKLRLAEGLTKAAASGSRLDKQQTDAVLEPLAKAVSAAPLRREECELFLDVCEHSSFTLNANNRNFLLTAVSLFPDDAELLWRIAAITSPGG
jgi:hypothetical protein